VALTFPIVQNGFKRRNSLFQPGKALVDFLDHAGILRVMVPVASSPENLDGQSDGDRRDTGEHENQCTFHNDGHFVSLLAFGCHTGRAGHEPRVASLRALTFSDRPSAGQRPVALFTISQRLPTGNRNQDRRRQRPQAFF